MSEDVIYKDVPSLPGYRVGSDGSVWTRWKKGRHWGRGLGTVWRKRKPSRLRTGHLSITFQGRSYSVHRIILESFVGPCPDGMECRHLDGNPANNVPANLRWGTRLENHLDRIKHGTVGKAKLTAKQVHEIRESYVAGKSVTQLASDYGVGCSAISNIIAGKTWKSVPPESPITIRPRYRSRKVQLQGSS